MRIDVLMPKMGESITEGKILTWSKSKGDRVDKDETILEISTDKVDTEVPAPEAGIIVDIFAQEGETVEVGAKIAIIETDSNAAVVSESPEPAATSVAPAATSVAPVATAASAAVPKEQPTVVVPVAPPAPKIEGKRFYSPVVMRMASESGIAMNELETIPGTGSGGRVTKKDIQDYIDNRGNAATPVAQTASHAAAATPTGEPKAAYTPVASKEGVDIVPMDNIKRLMAEHMVKSTQISPHVTLVAEVDMTKIVKFRERFADEFKRREGISLTYMPFIAEASVRALKDFPFVNASIDGTNILVKKHIGLGIAVAMTDGGLIVPVVKGADMMNRTGLARSISDLASRARNRRLQPDEIQDGTFTITNFGVFGSLFGTPIINQPQVAILGVGTLTKRPVVIEVDGEDTIAIRSMMMISITFDHRLIDGALGGQYLERVKQYLEGFSETSI